MPFHRWADMTRRQLAAPSQSTGSMIIGEHVTINRSVNEPGKFVRPHAHGCEQMLHVEQGTAWFRVGDEERTVTVGDVVHIPVGTEHEMRNVGDEDFIYLSFKNKSDDWPPRESGQRG